MAQVSITVNVEESDWDRFTIFCSSTGMNTSTAINLFVKAVLRENRIPFEIAGDPFCSPENQAYVMKSVRGLRTGGGTVHELIQADDAFRI